MLRMLMPATMACALVLCSACSGGDASSNAAAATPQAAQSAPRKVDPCSLLTPADVEAATSWKIRQSGPSKLTGACEFFGPNEFLDIVTVLIYPGPTTIASSAEMAAWRRKQLDASTEKLLSFQPIDDVGVPAIRHDVGGSTGILEASVRGYLLNVSARELPAAKQLLRVAIGRVP